MRGAIHDTFREITIHTAKCDLCNRHNTSKIYRCEKCGRQCCLECWDTKKGGDGRHNLHHKDSITYKGPKAEVLPPSLETGEKRKMNMAQRPKRQEARKMEVAPPDRDAKLGTSKEKRTSDELSTDGDDQADESVVTPTSRRAWKQAARVTKKPRWERSIEVPKSEDYAEQDDEDESEDSLTPDVSPRTSQSDTLMHVRSSIVDDLNQQRKRNHNLTSLASTTPLHSTNKQTQSHTADHAGLNSIVQAVDILETLNRTSHQTLSPIKGVFKTEHQPLYHRDNGFTPINNYPSAASTPTPPSNKHTNVQHRKTPKMKVFAPRNTPTTPSSTSPIELDKSIPVSSSSSSTLSPPEPVSIRSSSTPSTPRMKTFHTPSTPRTPKMKTFHPTPSPGTPTSSSSTISPPSPSLPPGPCSLHRLTHDTCTTRPHIIASMDEIHTVPPTESFIVPRENSRWSFLLSLSPTPADKKEKKKEAVGKKGGRGEGFQGPKGLTEMEMREDFRRCGKGGRRGGGM
ncbi:MAG: hypothetical protein Q9220_000465 [cf. Caloplaca sp. 1 TL-2023]